MNNENISVYGVRMNKLIISFSKDILSKEFSNDDFKSYCNLLTNEEKQLLLKKMKIYQLQRFSIKNNIWKDFSDNLLGNKKRGFHQFAGINFASKIKEKFTYHSEFYKMTEFRIILQQHLLQKNEQNIRRDAIEMDTLFKEKITLFKEKIALIVQIYRTRKVNTPSSFDDIIGPDIMYALSSCDRNKIINLMNTYHE